MLFMPVFVLSRKLVNFCAYESQYFPFLMKRTWCTGGAEISMITSHSHTVTEGGSEGLIASLRMRSNLICTMQIPRGDCTSKITILRFSVRLWVSWKNVQCMYVALRDRKRREREWKRGRRDSMLLISLISTLWRSVPDWETPELFFSSFIHDLRDILTYPLTALLRVKLNLPTLSLCSSIAFLLILSFPILSSPCVTYHQAHAFIVFDDFFA